MKKILITGSDGFIGKNLLSHLNKIDGLELLTYDLSNNSQELNNYLKHVDFVFHLAGVNRPVDIEEFKKGNVDLTQQIVEGLIANKNFAPVILSSSTQATKANPYGESKLGAEQLLINYIKQGGSGAIYRLTNVFGKWCRPNYNSVVATFCHNISRNIEISISDTKNEVELVHVDDVVKELIGNLSNLTFSSETIIRLVTPTYKVTLGDLSDLIFSFKNIPLTGVVPNMADDFVRKLHSTYLSYTPLENAVYALDKKTDDRGYLFELIKSKALGQIFISRTKPGITRGNHFHHQKNEKFCVIDGDAEIKFRHIITNETKTFVVNGFEPKVVDILPGYTHSITNLGNGDLITLFWANEPFNSNNPDTFFESV